MQVFNCDAAHCGQFYHLHCVAQRITRNPTKQQAYINGIKEGSDTFLCPLHKCKSCKKLEDGTEKDMQYAKCRRCPSGWHVQCLPTSVSNLRLLLVVLGEWQEDVVPCFDVSHPFKCNGSRLAAGFIRKLNKNTIYSIYSFANGNEAPCCAKELT